MLDNSLPDSQAAAIKPADAQLNGSAPPRLETTPPNSGLSPSPAPAPAIQHPVVAWLTQSLVSFGISLAIFAVGGVVTLIVLLLLGMRFRDTMGIALVVNLVGAFVLRSFVPVFATKAQAAPQAAHPQQTDSAREIVETVVFVVVLVLLLKSFAAEAFVIPTGSMAQTLWGYQKVVTCPECHIEFPVNCSGEVDPSDGSPPTKVTNCTCPNCRLSITLGAPKELKPEAGSIPDPGWHSGDRVLVAKFVYDLFERLPDRLDVVVFKFPGDDSSQRASFPATGPIKKHVPINYIKRLIGLPGETIAIHRGKLFVLSPEKATQNGLAYHDVEKAGDDLGKQIQLWRFPHMHHNDDDALTLFKDGKFVIIRKKPDNLLAMRRLVYDNDHQATDLASKPDAQRWVPVEKTGWAGQGKTAFQHDGTGNDKNIDWLRYRHVLRGKDKPELITDFMGYNTGNADAGSLGGNWASDLMVECEVDVQDAKGTFALELSRGPERYQALFDVGTGTCTLWQIKEGEKAKELKPSVTTTLKGKGKFHVRFANADDRLVVWVDERLPFGDGVELDTPEKLLPTVENDLERPVSVGSRNAKVNVSKLVVYRDTYYTTARVNVPSNKDVESFDPAQPDTWKNLETSTPSTYFVQPNHFLCLGDNSPQSSDGRSWGLVPRRLLLGRALLVYYPFTRAGRIR